MGRTRTRPQLAKRSAQSRYNLWLRLEAYNALNMMNWANLTLTVTSSDSSHGRRPATAASSSTP
jgi:hypothetical protein